MILHTINKPAAARKCRDLVAEDDIVLLLEDGVYLALKAPQDLPFSNAHLAVLIDDAKARGIVERIVAAEAVDYAGFVELTVKADKVVAWF